MKAGSISPPIGHFDVVGRTRNIHSLDIEAQAMMPPDDDPLAGLI